MKTIKVDKVIIKSGKNKKLTLRRKKEIITAVKQVVKEYGETLRLLGAS